MKIILILLVALPIVALAAPTTQAPKDAQKVAQEVLDEVDGLSSSVFMATSVLFVNTTSMMERGVESAKAQFDIEKEHAKENLEETKQKVNATYQVVKAELIKNSTEASDVMKFAQGFMDQEFELFKIRANYSYGDLAPKVVLALDNALVALHRIVDVAYDRLCSAASQIEDQLNWYTDNDYESTLYQYPGAEQYGKAVHVLKKGLNKCVNVMKMRIEQVHEEWKTVDFKKIDEDIKRTITA